MKLEAPTAPIFPARTSSSNAASVSSCGVSGSNVVRHVERDALEPEPLEARLDLPSDARAGRARGRAPSSIGLNVFVSIAIASRTAEPFVASHSPIQVSLRPPPYASAVSNVVIPSSQAASMIRGRLVVRDALPEERRRRADAAEVPAAEDDPRDGDPAPAELARLHARDPRSDGTRSCRAGAD